MEKSKLKLLFTESFFPFLLGIIILILSLLFIDQKIDNHDDVFVINLNREIPTATDEATIEQKIDISKINENQKNDYEQINYDIDEGHWKKAIAKINQVLGKNHQNNSELILTLGYLYYKEDNYKSGLKVLNSIPAEERNPRYYYNLGLVQSHLPGNYSDSIKNFEQFLTFKDGSYEATINIAHVYYRMNDYKNALKYYKDAAELSNLIRKSKALFGSALCLEKLKNNKGALELLDTAIQLDPENPAPRVHRAEFQLKSDPEKSLRELEKLSEIYPEYIETYHILANYYIDHDQNEKALNWMKTGLRQSPNSTVIQSNLGTIYLKLNEYDKALKIFNELSSQFPSDSFYYFNIARCYYGKDSKENFLKAIEYYQKALEIRPKYYEALVNMGIVYSKLSYPEKAIYFYNKALKINETSSIYYNLGVLYSRSKKSLEAIKSYEKALSLKNNYPQAYFNIAIAYTTLYNFQKAEKAYEKAIELDNKYVNAYYNLALAYKHDNLTNAAITLLEKGKKLTNNPRLINLLADFYISERTVNKAIELFQETLGEEPENETALMELAEIYLKERNYKKCLEYVQKFLFLQPKSTEGRYLNMVCLYQGSNYQEAMKQYKVLNRLSPRYRDSENYRDLIMSQIKGST